MKVLLTLVHCSFTRGLPHFLFKPLKPFEQDKFNFYSKKTNEHLGELLCGQWSYAKLDSVGHNYDALWEIDVYDNDYFYLEVQDFKSKPNKSIINMCKPSINEISLQPTTEADGILLQYCECIDINDVDNYSTWIKLMWSLYGHKEIARKLSRMGDEKLNRKDEEKKNIK